MGEPDANRNRPTEGGTVPKSLGHDRTSVDELDRHISHFQARVLADAYASAHASTWERRAADFEWARERPGDFIGRSTTPAQRAERDARLAAIAAACRARAQVSPIRDDLWMTPVWPVVA